MSAIEWTDQTWNPIVGCSFVSPGCTNCYAMKEAYRFGFNPKLERYRGLTKQVNGNAVWTGKLARAPHATLLAPLKRKKPTTYFVNSMGDLLHEDCPDEWIDQVFAVMALTPRHTFQVLTKRSARMREYFAAGRERLQTRWLLAARAMLGDDAPGSIPDAFPVPNVWLGVSTERQREADERIPHLLQMPAAVRFISAEPLLGPIDLRGIPHGLSGEVEDWPKLDWVIVGGESGPKARPMSIQWARELRDQCTTAGVPFFFKQWGEWAPAGLHRSGDPGRFAFGDYEHDRSTMIEVDAYPRAFTRFGARAVVRRFGKRFAGRMLDGVEHSEFPTRNHSDGI